MTFVRMSPLVAELPSRAPICPSRVQWGSLGVCVCVLTPHLALAPTSISNFWRTNHECVLSCQRPASLSLSVLLWPHVFDHGGQTPQTLVA